MISIKEKIEQDFPGIFGFKHDKDIESKILELKEEQEQIKHRIAIFEKLQNGYWNSFIYYLNDIAFPGCRCDTDERHEDDGLFYNPETNVLHVCMDSDYSQGGCYPFNNVVRDVAMMAKKFGVQLEYYRSEGSWDFFNMSRCHACEKDISEEKLTKVYRNMGLDKKIAEMECPECAKLSDIEYIKKMDEKWNKKINDEVNKEFDDEINKEFDMGNDVK